MFRKLAKATRRALALAAGALLSYIGISTNKSRRAVNANDSSLPLDHRMTDAEPSAMRHDQPPDTCRDGKSRWASEGCYDSGKTINFATTSTDEKYSNLGVNNGIESIAPRNNVADVTVDEDKDCAVSSFEQIDSNNLGLDDNTQQKAQTGDYSRQKPIRMIGGRRESSKGKTDATDKSVSTCRPRTVCKYNGERACWEVAVMDSANFKIKRIKLLGEQYEMEHELIVFPSISTSVFVESVDGEEHSIDFGNGKPLLFMFNDGYNEPGTMVKRINVGRYAIFASENTLVPGSEHRETEPSQYCGYKVNFRFCNSNEMSKQDRLAYQEVGISITESWMNLAGNCVYDDLRKGILYIGDTPTLDVSGDIDLVLVGYETENSWKKEFYPKHNTLSSVIERREGHFFLRGFCNGKRVASTQFRLLRDLVGIQIDGKEYTEETALVPESNGYRNITIKFLGLDSHSIFPLNVGEGRQFHHESNGTLLVISSPMTFAIMVCVMATGGSVDICVEVPWLWWQFDPAGSVREEWTDKNIVMTRSEYKMFAKTNKKVYILSKKLSRIEAGFEGGNMSFFKRKLADEVIEIPLVDFRDYDEVTSGSNRPAYLCARVSNNDYRIIEIQPDEPVSPMPDTSLEFSQGSDSGTCSDSRSHRVISRHCDSWRRGRGYSYSELAASGWSKQQAKRHGIRIDKRRRSCHEVNLVKLEEMKSDE